MKRTKIVYSNENCSTSKTANTIKWLAAICSYLSQITKKSNKKSINYRKVHDMNSPNLNCNKPLNQMTIQHNI